MDKGPEMRNWIFENNIEPFLTVFTESRGAKLDEDDLVAIRFGIQATDAEAERWFDYLVNGERAELHFSLARDSGTSVVWVRGDIPVDANGTEMLFLAFQRYHFLAKASVSGPWHKNADWKRVDTQNNLNDLNQKVCWDDSTVVEYYAKETWESYFPQDVAGSSGRTKNIHILVDLCGGTPAYLEYVLIGCDLLSHSSLNHLALVGRVDGKKRVEVQDARGTSLMRCNSLIYRFLPQEAVRRPYFKEAGSISSQ